MAIHSAGGECPVDGAGVRCVFRVVGEGWKLDAAMIALERAGDEPIGEGGVLGQERPM
jgi:hypothetical protein